MVLATPVQSSERKEFDEHLGDTIDAYLDAAKEAGIDTDATQAAVEAKEWDFENYYEFH